MIDADDDDADDDDDDDDDHNVDKHEKLFTTKATLVVAPTHVVRQWEAEARKFLASNACSSALRFVIC